jgi:hypothetical protein
MCELSSKQAGKLIQFTMNSPVHGYSEPEMVNILRIIHQEKMGEEACTWIPRPDINRWQCMCDLFVMNLPLQIDSGTWRN